jgi:hypothetical protein
MLLLVGAALRTFPLTFPQITALVTGMDPLDPEFRRKWSSWLEWVGKRLLAPAIKSGDKIDGKAATVRKRSPSRTAAGSSRHQGS